MTQSSEVPLGRFRADGGAAANNWLMQFQSDLLGTDVYRPEANELTAIGAAGLAGVGIGFWARPEEFLGALGGESVFSPGEDAEDRRDRVMTDWRRAIRAVIGWSEDVPG